MSPMTHHAPARPVRLRLLRGTLGLLLGLVLLSPLSLPLLAQPAFGGPGGGPHAAPGAAQQAPPFHPERIARILDLSEAQVEQTRGLLDELAARVQPIHEESRQLRQELEDLLAGDAPDPAAVGTRLIRIHALQDVARAARADFEAAFTALLTPEQHERWDLLKDIRAFLGGPRGGRGPRA